MGNTEYYNKENSERRSTFENPMLSPFIMKTVSFTGPRKQPSRLNTLCSLFYLENGQNT